MKQVHFSSQYKRDFKKYRNDRAKVAKILEVVRILERGEALPAKYKAHKLVGDYAGCIECHVESDLLLICIDEEEQIIRLVRLGSHSELF